MEPFSPTPPQWTETAIHAYVFQCPHCQASPQHAKDVWINRRAPVYSEDYHKKWQEFYACECGTNWWAWSSDRPKPSWREPKQTDREPDV